MTTTKTATNTITATFDEYRATVEQALESAIPADCKVGEAARYSALGGGKRVRGVLVLEFCRLFGGEPEKAAPAAAAIELVHAFSLVHDDLPCMDDDDFRRGKPSCHKQYGEATALLAGDALLALAFGEASKTELAPLIPALRNAVMDMLNGQQLDMEYENMNEITSEQLLLMYQLKTCGLIGGACACGAICAGATLEQIHKARDYGNALGLAFQITDDLLDIGSEKPRKQTLPKLTGSKKAEKLARGYTRVAIKIAERLPGGEFLKQLAISLVNRSE